MGEVRFGSSRARSSGPESSDLAKEVTQLRKENARLKMEHDIIKKLGYFAADPQ